MSERTGISWTDHTLNLWIGCVEAGPECDNCYAREMAQSKRWARWGAQEPRHFTSKAIWNAPLLWNRKAKAAGERRRVFCQSLSDILEDRRDLDEARAWAWHLVEECDWLDFLFLTKRPANFARLTPAAWRNGSWPRNAWAGTTAGTQKTANVLAWQLIMAAGGAPVRFVSVEPLLERVDLTRLPWKSTPQIEAHYFDALTGQALLWGEGADQRALVRIYPPVFERISWVIVGFESGAGRREGELSWLESIARQCDESGAALWVKQDGAFRPGQQGRIPDALWKRKELPA